MLAIQAFWGVGRGIRKRVRSLLACSSWNRAFGAVVGWNLLNTCQPPHTPQYAHPGNPACANSGSNDDEKSSIEHFSLF